MMVVVGLSQRFRQQRSLGVSYLLDRSVTNNRRFVGKLHYLMVWMLVLRTLRFLGGVVLLYRAIRPGVVLVVVNLPARIVLLMIDLCALVRRKLAAVGRTVVADFAIQFYKAAVSERDPRKMGQRFVVTLQHPA